MHMYLHLIIILILQTMKFDELKQTDKHPDIQKSTLAHSSALRAKQTYSIVHYIALEQSAVSEAFTFNYKQSPAFPYTVDSKGLVFR